MSVRERSTGRVDVPRTRKVADAPPPVGRRLHEQPGPLTQTGIPSFDSRRPLLDASATGPAAEGAVPAANRGAYATATKPATTAAAKRRISRKSDDVASERARLPGDTRQTSGTSVAMRPPPREGKCVALHALPHRWPEPYVPHAAALNDALGVARGLFRGEILLPSGSFEPTSDADAEEIMAVTLGVLIGVCGVTDESLTLACAALARPEEEATLGTALADSLLAQLRSVRWSPSMLALFRAVAVHRAVPKLVLSDGSGAIPLSTANDALVGQMRGGNGQRAGFVVPAYVLPRPVLGAAERERIATALAEILLRSAVGLNAA